MSEYVTLRFISFLSYMSSLLANEAGARRDRVGFAGLGCARHRSGLLAGGMMMEEYVYERALGVDSGVLMSIIRRINGMRWDAWIKERNVYVDE